jgi:hypothetical protein
LKEGLYMSKVGRKILFDGCNYDCFNCTYPDCYCPDYLAEHEVTLEKQRIYLRKTRERAMRSYERRHQKND